MTIKVMFVCMGNICRSPTAHGVFRKLIQDEGLNDDIYIESSGTHAYHVGESPDSRAQSTARGRGIELGDLRAQKIKASDFENFDYVLAMDEDNYSILSSLCPSQYRDRLQLFLNFADDSSVREVPDPYYGGASGFDYVFDLVEEGSRGLLADIRARHL